MTQKFLAEIMQGISHYFLKVTNYNYLLICQKSNYIFYQSNELFIIRYFRYQNFRIKLRH